MLFSIHGLKGWRGNEKGIRKGWKERRGGSHSPEKTERSSICQFVCYLNKLNNSASREKRDGAILLSPLARGQTAQKLHSFGTDRRLGLDFEKSRAGRPRFVAPEPVVFRSRQIAVIAVGQFDRERNWQRAFAFYGQPGLDESFAWATYDSHVPDANGL